MKTVWQEQPKSAREKTIKNQDYIISNIIFRSFIFLLILIFLFCNAKWGTNLFKNFKHGFYENRKKDYMLEELVDVFHKIEKPLKEQSQKVFHEIMQSGKGGEDLGLHTKKYSLSPIFITSAFHLPLDKIRVTSPYGMRKHPITKKKGVHTGIDLAAAMSSPIYAAMDGVVVERSYSKYKGNYLVLQHGENMKTIYCHCNTLIAKKGDFIRGGEKIAEVGSTGQSTGPHLHFEIMCHGVFYNPIWLLSYVYV